MQHDLEILQKCKKHWYKEFHKKCPVLNITNKKKLVKYSYTIHGYVLEIVHPPPRKIPLRTHPKPFKLEYTCK